MYDDQTLQDIQNRGGGDGRAAGHLLRLPIHLRAIADSEGTIMGHMTGARYADAVALVVDRFLRGDLTTPYTMDNQQIIDREQIQRWGHARAVAAILDPREDLVHAFVD